MDEPVAARPVVNTRRLPYTVREACKLLRLSRPSITEYISRGKIRAEKVRLKGKEKWAISVEEMNRLVAARETGTWPRRPGAPSREELVERVANDTARELERLRATVGVLSRELGQLRRVVECDPPKFSEDAVATLPPPAPTTASELLAALRFNDHQESHIVARLQGDNLLTRLVSVWPSMGIPPNSHPDEPLPPDFPEHYRNRWLFSRIEPDPFPAWYQLAGYPDAPHVRRASWVAIDMRMVFSDGTLHHWARKYVAALAFDALPVGDPLLGCDSASPPTGRTPV
jgi:excisionase family DNA binding protein